MRKQPHQPKRIGDFEIIRHLAAGGMGVVYLANQISLSRLCALKVLGGALTHPQHLKRFQREARSVARLQHSSIPRIYFVGQDNRSAYMAMEYIEGASLRTLIRGMARSTKSDSTLDDFNSDGESDSSAELVRFDDIEYETEDFDSANDLEIGDLSEEAYAAIESPRHINRCVSIIREIAAAVGYAHQNGIVHRDLKPENVMVNKDGKVFVIDFGVAQFLDDATLTQTGQLVGTPIYMSPEQVTGRIMIDARTDIYSLGIVLYEMLTLQPPITSPTREGVLRRVISKQLNPVSWFNNSVPKPLENIVHKMTAKDADDRYSSVEQLLVDLDRQQAGEAVAAPDYRLIVDTSEIRASRPIAILVAVILAFLSIPGAISFLIIRSFFSEIRATTLVSSWLYILLVVALAFNLTRFYIEPIRRNLKVAKICCLTALLCQAFILYVDLIRLAQNFDFAYLWIQSIGAVFILCFQGGWAHIFTPVVWFVLRRRDVSQWLIRAEEIRAETLMRKGHGVGPGT